MSTAALVDVLSDARERGLLGPGPVDAHIQHGNRLAALVEPAPPRFLDLGSGAGVPGLVLARCWPDADGVLIDASIRRCEWLEQAVEALEAWLVRKTRRGYVRRNSTASVNRPVHRDIARLEMRHEPDV